MSDVQNMTEISYTTSLTDPTARALFEKLNKLYIEFMATYIDNDEEDTAIRETETYLWQALHAMGLKGMFVNEEQP